MDASTPDPLLRELRALPRRPGDPSSWGLVRCRERGALLDALLREAFTRAPRPGALAAVGSYGRGTPSLGSDIDVRWLVPAGVTVAVDELLYPLWDAGLQVGHQVVTPDELLALAERDLPTATSLLDWRFLIGDQALSDELQRAARARLLDPAFLERLGGWLDGEVTERHERFGGSVYLLEPDVKSGAGGLRDLDVVGWLLQLLQAGADLERLGEERLVAPPELTRLLDARELLARVRNLLHASAGRRADRLTFDQQEAIARRLGYDRAARAVLDAQGGDDEQELAVAVEAFMSDYYRGAQLIARVLERVLRRRRPLRGLSPVSVEGETSAGLALRDGHLELAPGRELAHEPALALRLYAEAMRLGVPVGAASRERVAQAAQDEAVARALQTDPLAAQLFLRLCIDAAETPQLGRTVMDELREVGLLVAMIPEFSPVVGRVHHDIYHVYTVDVHSVAALDRLKALVRGELAEQFPLACRLAAEEIQPEVLHLATLLHDVGKALGGRDHASRGALMATTIAQRLGLTEAQAARVAHLVHAHLDMYHVATRRDLDDPASLDDFVQHLHGRENLRELYLLTVADISTTSPTALTAWKAKLLEDLYRAADARLLGHHDLDEERLRFAYVTALERSGADPFARSFLDSMPDRYLLANAPDAIAMHLEVARAAVSEGVACGLRPSGIPGLAELCVATLDRPGLLAAIAAALVEGRLEIHGAQIFSHPLADGRTQVVDLFWVRGAALDRLDRLRPALLARLQDYIAQRRSVASALEIRPNSPWASRHTPAVATDVAIDDRSSPVAAIVEVTTRDRPGVLCALALAFHRLGLSISLAKINTEGTRVADVFYVTDEGGRKIELMPRKAEIREAIVGILAALDPSAAPPSPPPHPSEP